ncbi:MAG: hypothetical protein KKH83_07695 [Candidatus Margulisbacteria bacterium]|nr:hypothetical protein [Candidatus Margulisiibacteriota bacterium]
MGRYSLKHYSERTEINMIKETFIYAVVGEDKLDFEIKSKGINPIDAFLTGLRRYMWIKVDIFMHEERALISGNDPQALACIGLRHGARTAYGIGMDSNKGRASIKALLNALNKIL